MQTEVQMDRQLENQSGNQPGNRLELLEQLRHSVAGWPKPDQLQQRMADLALLRTTLEEIVQDHLDYGEMPVFASKSGPLVTLSPSAQKPGQLQATRYNNTGAMGDSHYADISQAITGEMLMHMPLLVGDEAAERMQQVVEAEAAYQEQRRQREQALEHMLAPQPAQDEPQEPELQEGEAAVAPEEAFLAVHNLSQENILFASRMGGLASPSIGIVTTQRGHISGFGAITLIGSPLLGLPQEQPVFSGDAYTMRYPEPVWKKASEAAASKVLKDIGDVARLFEESSLVSSSWNLMRYRPDGRELMRIWSRSQAIQHLFLAEKGIATSPVMRPINLLEPLTRAQLLELQPLVNELELLVASMGYEVAIRSAHGQPAYDLLAQQLHDMTEAATGHGWQLDARVFADLVQGCAFEDMMMVDRWETHQAIDAKLKPHELEFSQWLHEKMDDIFQPPRVLVGRKLKPYTLENVVEAMTRRDTRGKDDSTGFSSGRLIAEISEKFTSRQAMWQQRERIANLDHLEKNGRTYNALLTRFQTLAVKASTAYLPGGGDADGNPFIDIVDSHDNALRALARWIIAGDETLTSLRRFMARHNFNPLHLDESVLAAAIEARDATMRANVGYFESKPQRAVRLSEFVGALVPENVSQMALDILRDHHLEVRQYPVGINEMALMEQIRAFAQDLHEQGREVLFSKSIMQMTGLDARLQQKEGEAQAAALAAELQRAEDPPRDSDEVRDMLLERFGSLFNHMEAAGLVRICDSEQEALDWMQSDRDGDLPGNRKTSPIVGSGALDGTQVQGLHDARTGRSYLIAPHIRRHSVSAVFLHEVGVHAMRRKPTAPALFHQALELVRNEQGEFMDRVRARLALDGLSLHGLDPHSSAGSAPYPALHSPVLAEECAAYIVEEYEASRFIAPRGVNAWMQRLVQDTTSRVRAWLHDKGLLRTSSLRPADMHAIACANVRRMAGEARNKAQDYKAQVNKAQENQREGVQGHAGDGAAPAMASRTPGQGGAGGAGSKGTLPGFSQWFGDSKVRDAARRPLRMYHGTSEDFTRFHIGDRPASFTDNPAVAAEYLDRQGQGVGQIMPVYLQIDKPFRLNARKANWDAIPLAYLPQEMQDRIRAMDAATPADCNRLIDAVSLDHDSILQQEGNKSMMRRIRRSRTAEGRVPVTSIEVIARAAREMGYTGVMARDLIDGFYTGTDARSQTPPSMISMVFEPGQVKSAIGNDGSYDRSSPDILHSVDAVADEVDAAKRRIRLEEARAEAARAMQLRAESIPAFRQWFCNSQLVDADGRPLVLYRGEGNCLGRGANFTQFDRNLTGENAFFFSFSYDVAQSYAYSRNHPPTHQREPRAFFLQADRLLDARTSEGIAFIRRWARAWDEEGWIDRQTGEEVDPVDLVMEGRLFDYEGNWSGERWKDLQASIEIEGYDAALLPDLHGADGVIDSIIVFRPEQIKSATDNNGQYSREDPDILRSVASAHRMVLDHYLQAQSLDRWHAMEQGCPGGRITEMRIDTGNGARTCFLASMQDGGVEMVSGQVLDERLEVQLRAQQDQSGEGQGAQEQVTQEQVRDWSSHPRN